MIQQKVKIAYLIDPRFSGGTSFAIAQELDVVTSLADVDVHAFESRLFSGRTIAPVLEETLARRKLNLHWNEPVISADIVIVQNPIFLKYQTTPLPTIVTRHIITVSHENFLRPGGEEGFDVEHCLNLVSRSSTTLKRSIAPISPHNRSTVLEWLSKGRINGWSVLDRDWFNICEFDFVVPTTHPTDRRGRHSRAAFEKFPRGDDLDLCFPAHAKSNVILGADRFIDANLFRPHWQMHRFRSLSLDEYFKMFDFMVYFVAPTWSESFGRVIAEAIAAGKIVVTDAETASCFGPGVIGTVPCNVDPVIQRFIAEPSLFGRKVDIAQNGLRRFSARAFADFFLAVVDDSLGVLV